ncbi:unnamed protein product [Periconia digitata]|uniref:Uncharacterized protein n=1 Tax=Periconia digitata TaxID=1303443 RepID=A0A9W4UDP3_9PLEO|nr:unnamed protein product [Periconia digitata]
MLLSTGSIILEWPSEQRRLHIPSAIIKSFHLFQDKLLEWIECLVWLGKASEILQTLELIDQMAQEPELSLFARDAMIFYSRHRKTIQAHPLQVYTSAMVWGWKSSLVRLANLEKVLPWLVVSPRGDECQPHFIRKFPLVPLAPEHSSNRRLDKMWKKDKIAFSQNGERLVWARPCGDDIFIQDVRSGEIYDSYSKGWITKIAVDARGDKVVWSHPDRVSLWTVGSRGKSLQKIGRHSDAILGVACSSDGETVMSMSQKEIKIWSSTAKPGENLLSTISMPEHVGYSRNVYILSPDGQHFAILGVSDKQPTLSLAEVKIWIYAMDKTDPIEDDKFQLPVSGLDALADAYFVPNKKFVLGSEAWDLEPCPWGSLPVDPFHLYDWATDLVFSPGGRRVATITNRQVYLWEAPATRTDDSPHITTIVLSPDGKRTALIKRTVDYFFCYLLTDATGHMQELTEGVRKVYFSPDGMRVATVKPEDDTPSSYYMVEVWDTATGERECSIRIEGYVANLAFSPDRKLVAFSHGANISLYYANNGTFFRQYLDTRDEDPLGFSPDSLRLISCDEHYTGGSTDVNERHVYDHWEGDYSPDVGTLHCSQDEVDGSIPVYSSDGKHIVFHNPRHVYKLRHVLDIEAKSSRTEAKQGLYVDENSITSMGAPQADGWLCYGDKRILKLGNGARDLWQFVIEGNRFAMTFRDSENVLHGYFDPDKFHKELEGEEHSGFSRPRRTGP